MRQWIRAGWGLASYMVALAPLPAFALDWTPDNSPYLGDPTYLTPAHHLNGVTTLGHYDVVEDLVLPSGATSPHYTENRNTIFQELSYGITERLVVGASIGYGQGWSTDTYSSGPRDFHAQGFFNPSFGANWRAIAQEPGGPPFNLDIGAAYSPSVFAARNASTNTSGTLASGEETAGLKIAISRKWTDLTLQGYVAAAYDDERKEFQTSDGSTRTYGTNFVYGAGFDGQLRFAQRFYVGAGSAVLQQTDTSLSDPAESISFNRSYDPTFDNYVLAGWQVVPNRVALEAEYDRDYYGDEAEQGATGPVGTWKNQIANAYYLRLRYMLF